MKCTIKYFILTILLQVIYCPSEISGQSADHRNMLVYWYNRERLKHFVIPGLKMGESNLAGIRNRLDYESNPNENLDFGQDGIYFGYYLGTLATEYRLLMNGNHYQAALETEREVVYALHQYIAFMDSS